MRRINQIRSRLEKSITTQNQTTFFKTGVGEYAEHDRFMGVTVPSLRIIAKEFADLSLEEVQHLIESPFNEERFLALIILVQQYKKEQENIYQFYLENLRHVNNWNLVDASAHLIIGAHLLKRDRSSLISLAQSNNMWKRRIAIVSTWYFIRHNDLEWTFKLGEMLLRDSHDLIHKAVGWMLREAGKRDEGRLIAFLDYHSTHMPRTMLRYAIEKISEQQRKKILQR